MAYTPPAPPRPAEGVYDDGARMGAAQILRAVRDLGKNPLTIWSDRYYREPVVSLRFLGRDIVLVSDPRLARQVLVTDADSYRFSAIRQAVFQPILPGGLLTDEGELWAKTRRALTPVFTPRHVRGFAPVMARIAAEREGRLEAEVDATELALDLTLDILLGCLFPPDAPLDRARFFADVEGVLTHGGTPHPLDIVAAPPAVPRWGRGPLKRHVASLRAQVARIREAHDGEDGTDLLSLLMRAGRAEGEPLTPTQVDDNLLTFLLAGHETTARSVAWTLALLSEAEDAREAVEAELDAAELDGTDPADWQAALPVLTATIRESLRLYPPASHLSRTATAPVRICERDYPKGTSVAVSSWLVHRHEANWDEPGAFRPERFAGPDAHRRNDAYLPFGMGPRVCIGASFAMQELVIVLATLLRRHRFALRGAMPVPVMRVTLVPDAPLVMAVTDRLQAAPAAAS